MKSLLKISFCPLLVALFMATGFRCHCIDIGSVPSEDASNRPLVEDGKSWVVTYSYVHGWLKPFKAECYYIDGDTLVGSQLCKKLMLRINDIENNSIATSLDKLVFEKDRKVYYYPANNEKIMAQPILLYDFSACTGDTLSLGGVPDNETLCFQIWDTPQLTWGGVTFNGQLATVYDPELTENDVFDIRECPYRWYESIGSTEHPFLKLPWLSGAPQLLRDCRVGDRVVYQNWVDAALFPDVTGDGMVDIADVNAVINMMLHGITPSPSPSGEGSPGDITGDGRVDIADVNAVINAMLDK